MCKNIKSTCGNYIEIDKISKTLVHKGIDKITNTDKRRMKALQ